MNLLHFPFTSIFFALLLSHLKIARAAATRCGRRLQSASSICLFDLPLQAALLTQPPPDPHALTMSAAELSEEDLKRIAKMKVMQAATCLLRARVCSEMQN